MALKLGLTSFGGPIAHLGYFERTYVRERRWLSPEQYVDRFRDRLPEEQWQIDGFLVDLEVLTRPPTRDPGIPGAVP